MKPKVIQIIGSPRSGTTLLEYVLSRTYKELVIIIHGKHWSRDTRMKVLEGEGDVEQLFQPLLETHSAGYVRCIPSVKSSFNSKGMYYAKPAHPRPVQATREVIEIIRSAIESRDITYVMNIRHPVSNFVSWVRHWDRRQDVSKWANGWNDLYTTWLDWFLVCPSQRCATVRYEDLLFAPYLAMQSLESNIPFLDKRRTVEFVLLPKSQLSPSVTKMREQFERRDYYWHEDYWLGVKDAELVEIRKWVKNRIMDNFGYTWARNLAR